MKNAPLEGTRVKVTHPTFASLFGDSNEFTVIGQGRKVNGEFLYNCKPVNGGTVYQFAKEELEQL